jgi:hypothetical protein
MSDLSTELREYEVTSWPVMAGPRLGWRPWIFEAVAPYVVTTMPRGTECGLAAALRRAETDRCHSARVVQLEERVRRVPRSLAHAAAR